MSIIVFMVKWNVMLVLFLSSVYGPRSIKLNNFVLLSYLTVIIWLYLIFSIFILCSIIGTVNPKVLLELFSMYRDWQEEKAKQISKRQVCIANHKFWECKTNSTNMDGYDIKIVKANVQLRSAVDPYEFHMRSIYFCT